MHLRPYVFLLWFVAGCSACSGGVELSSRLSINSHSSPVADFFDETGAEIVHLSNLRIAPLAYHGRRIAVEGICRWEFEGNGLYMDGDVSDSQGAPRGVWLPVGWPVPPEYQQYNNQQVVIRGIFNAKARGHWGAYPGSLESIEFIPKADSGRQ